MPVLHVQGLAIPQFSREDLLRLKQNLKSVVASNQALNITSDHVTVFIDVDATNGLPGVDFLEEIKQDDVVIDVMGLFDKPERTPEIRAGLARSIVEEVRHFIEEVGEFAVHGIIECLIHPFDPKNGYASS